jgi:hypothetical protein
VHSRSEFLAPNAGETNLSSYEITAPKAGCVASCIDSFANRSCGADDADAERIGWTSGTFAKNIEIEIKNYCACFRSAAIHTKRCPPRCRVMSIQETWRFPFRTKH